MNVQSPRLTDYDYGTSEASSETSSHLSERIRHFGQEARERRSTTAGLRRKREAVLHGHGLEEAWEAGGWDGEHDGDLEAVTLYRAEALTTLPNTTLINAFTDDMGFQALAHSKLRHGRDAIATAMAHYNLAEAYLRRWLEPIDEPR